MQALKSGQWSLSDSELSQLLTQLETTSQGEFDYGDWIAALIDWRDVQVRFCSCKTTKPGIAVFIAFPMAEYLVSGSPTNRYSPCRAMRL